MSSCSPRELGTKLSQSSTDLIATGGQDGGNTTLYSQRAMETEAVDVVVNLKASHGQDETTPLGTPIAMESKMIVSDEDFTAGNTTLSAPSAMETVNVESSGGLNARHGQGCEQDETIKLGTPSEMETKMIVLCEDLAVGKTSLSTLSAIEIVTVESSGDMIAGKTTSGTTPRLVEMELVDAGGDSIAEQNQWTLSQSSTNLVATGGQDGGNTTSYSQRAMETETVDVVVNLNASHGQGETTPLCTPIAMEAKMIVSDEDFTAENTTLSAPSAMETVNVESSGGLNARHGQGCEQDATIKLGTPSEMETKMIVLSEDLAVGKTSLSTLSAIEIVTVESSGDMIAGKTTSGTTPRVVEMELVDAGGDSIAKQNQWILSQSSTDLIATGGQDGGNTTSYPQRAMETETVDVVVNLNASHGQGETTPLCTPIAMEAKMIVSDEDFAAGNTTLSAPSAMETVNVESSGGLNARHGQGCEQDETIKLGTQSEMETKMIVLSEDLAVGKTSLSTLSAIEIVTVESSGDMTAEKTTSGTTPRVVEMELVDAGGDSIAEQNQWTLSQSRTDLIATGGKDGGNTTSYSQRAMETETVDVVVNLNASHGQGETTPLGTPIVMEAKMIVSDEDFTAGNTTLSTPSAMETVNVESSGGLNARHAQGFEQDETVKFGTPSEMETKMIVLSEDLAVGKTSLSTLSAIEIVTVESSGDMIAGKTTLGTTPRAVEMELVDAGGDSIVEQNQDHGQGNLTKFSISREKETETVVFRADLMETLKPIFGKGGNRTSGTPRAVKNKMAKTNVESITRCKRVCERGVIEKGPSSPEGKAIDKKRESPFPERASSSKRGARRGMQGTLNQPTQKRARVQEKNNEICDPGPKSIMEEGPSSSPERQATNNERGSLWLERVRSCKRGTKRGMQDTSSQPTQKRVRIVEQNEEVNNPGPNSIMEISPSSLERQAANKKRGSPSSDRVRSCKKTTFLWLIDSKIIKEDEQVSYRSASIEKPLAGRITRGGILCSCCQEEISMWTFESHAGSTLRQPYKHIYIHRKRKTLRKCMIDVWQHAREQKRRRMFLYAPKETDADQDDDVCSVCGDGGDLICCDRCPSTYHLSCINIETVPQNDWFCPYCVCKYCGLVVDLVVEKKRYYEKKEGFKCSQCDRKYHWECFEKYEKDSSKQTKPSRSYCGQGCQGIYAKMGVHLGIRKDYSAKYSWRVIRLMETYKNNPAYMNLFLENNSKVAVTWMLMNEAFEKITDRKTGINVVRSIVYSCKSNLSRIDFSRFYMFVLEEDDAIIAAASIRFHGSRIAEMPLIATDMTRRGQGVCKELMRVIESFLCNLKVKNLIIPSAVETCDMWKRKYNFTEVSEELKKEISSYKIVMFPGAVRLYKDLSASIAEIEIDLEPQTEHAEVTARLEHGSSHQED